MGAVFYREFLALVYRWFGSSHLLGQQLSILTFALSCIIFLKIMRQLKIVRHRLSALIVFGALPSMVLFGTTTLRESYQLLFFMLAVYFGIKMHKKGGINAYLIAMGVSALIMGLFHKALIVYAAFLTILFILYELKPATHFWSIKKLRLAGFLILPIILLGLSALSKVNLAGLDVLTKVVNLDFLQGAANHRESSFATMGNTTYGIPLDLSSPATIVLSTIKFYGSYLFGPFPWQVRSIGGAYACLVSILRMVLICVSISEWRKADGSHRQLIKLMLILYFSMTFIWALGTTNYGTAARHQMLSWWIIVIIGVPPSLTILSRIRLGPSKRKHSNPLKVTGKTA